MQLKETQISIVANNVKKGALDIRPFTANVNTLDNEYFFTVTSMSKRDMDRSNFAIGAGSVIFHEGNTFICTELRTMGAGKKYPVFTALRAQTVEALTPTA